MNRLTALASSRRSAASLPRASAAQPNKRTPAPSAAPDKQLYRSASSLGEQSSVVGWLHRAGQELGQTLDLLTIYRTLRACLAEQMTCDGLMVSSYDAQEGIVCRYAWQDGIEQDVTVFPPLPLEEEGRGTQSLVIRSGQSLLLKDYLAYWRTAANAYIVGEDGQIDRSEPRADATDVPRSALIVPLMLQKKVTGVLQLFSYRLDDYTERDLQLVESLAVYLAAAQVNALLFARATAEIEARQRAEAALVAEQEAARQQLEQRVHERTRALENEIAERKQVEAMLQARTNQLAAANEELAKAARLKDEFLATMSHELRTPLTGILGFSEGLRSGVYGPLTAAQLRPLMLIDESGRHLLGLINDILDLSKIEAGRLAVVVEDVLALDLCRSSLRLVSEQAEKKRQRVSCEVEPPDLLVQCDAHRMRQVLVNLLGNAVKFTPEEGALGVRVHAAPDAQAVYFEVWDTGIGIAPDQQAELFEPFTQVDSGLARRHGGAGVGLALVQRLVDLHGGSVTLSSVAGQGSSFVVSLPWGQFGALAAEPGAPPAS